LQGKEIEAREYKVCRAERKSKACVATGRADPRWSLFAEAKVIFATNAVKYHVNKLGPSQTTKSFILPLPKTRLEVMPLLLDIWPSWRGQAAGRQRKATALRHSRGQTGPGRP
jgi:hypothetical protein